MKHLSLLLRCTAVVLCCTLAGRLQAQCPTFRKLYVDASHTTAGDGSSWANAFTNLRQALAVASTCPSVDSILVARGTYRPATINSFNRDTSFVLPNHGLKLYGGYPTGGGVRNITANPTILSGEIGISGDSTDNSYHVIVVPPIGAANDSVVLDGFTIADGCANGSGTKTYGSHSYERNSGGGIATISSTIHIRNCTFTSNGGVNGGGMYNHGIYPHNGCPVVYNCVFSGNNATEGGGVHNHGDANYEGNGITMHGCVFSSNRSTSGGGALYTYNMPQNIESCLFYANSSATGAGMLNDNVTTSPFPKITNCTFYANTSTNSNSGTIHNYNPSSIISTSPIITNCIVWGNTPAAGIRNVNAFPIIKYCLIQNGSSGSNGNLNTDPLFSDPVDPDGDDNILGTADDGLYSKICGPAINAGDDNAYSFNTDVTGANRRRRGIVDMGAYEAPPLPPATVLAGEIGNAHTVPYPRELFNDSVTSVVAPAAGAVIRWQDSTSGDTWGPVAQPASTPAYRIPVLQQTTWYRRVANFCGTLYYSNVVRIKVANPNGAISGRVTSGNGTGVEGITITARRPASLPGSPAGLLYYGLTGSDGTYSISPVYYGDPDDANSQAGFIVKAFKQGHAFDPAEHSKQLSQNIPQIQNVDFEDTTVVSITGRTYQQCNDCITINNTEGTTACPIDSVIIYKDGTYTTVTGFIDTAYGRYAVNITDPALTTLTPSFTGHSFDPAYRSVTPTDNIAGIDFRDTTTHVISGKLTAGCGEYIGRATLEFSDVLPNNANGIPRASCFRKRVTTNSGSGTFSIRLPARKYSVSVIGFTPSAASGTPAYVQVSDLTNFFNSLVPKDSLTRNISTRDTVLNLEYTRPPVLKIILGLDSLCNGNNRGFALMQQAATDSFRLKVYQGLPTFNNGAGCLVKDTGSIQIFTNVPSEDATNVPVITAQPADTGVTVRLKGGAPNIISPYQKTINIQFTDQYNRPAIAINKKVLVTGVKADPATFTTVSPEIPMLVLHDPPGDASSSFWNSSQSSQTALRMYSASNIATNIWAEVKIGAKLSTGLFVSTEYEAWGSINASLNIGSRNTTSNETILTTTATQFISTSSDLSVTGADGDVYVGAAMNVVYAPSTEIAYKNCAATSTRKLMVGNDGFATQYIYTERHIKNVVIPTLRQLENNPGNTPAQTRNYRNQISVWQQVLNNNAANRARAAFDKNISFDGSAGPVSNTTTTRVSKSSTVEFAMNIDVNVAAALGLEVAGSGASGGVDVMFKTETGNSTNETVTEETTTGYTLDDNDNGDYFSVNIKKDPVYSTPVFELVAGTASCPPEENAQPRDEIQFSVPVPSISGIPENGEAQFTLKIGNTSPSTEPRTYLLSFDQGSNPNGAIVTIGGSPVLTPISYTIGYLGEVQVTVTVKKPASSNIFSFEGLKFTVTDACGGSISASNIISAYFVSQCSAITLEQPENGWMMNGTANNLLPVLMKDYTIAGLTNIALEYATAGTSNWVTAFTKAAGELNTNGITGTHVNWNTAFIPDGAYNLRLKLTCAQGTVYSQRTSGIIDRTAPTLYGIPEPTDDIYTTGDIIAFTYNEKLNTNTSNVQAVVRRLSNNQLIPVTVSIFENRLIITPNSSIAGFVADSIRVIVTGVADQYGNMKANADTTRFMVGTSVAGTGNNALTVSIANPRVYKNSDSTIDIIFSLPANAANNTRINYSIGGTARLGVDYTIVYPATQPSYAYFNGAQGAIQMAQNTGPGNIEN